MIIDEIEELLTGNKPAREADRVLATVLFTDIVGATQAVVDRGDRRWLELLKEHHALGAEGACPFPRTRSQYDRRFLYCDFRRTGARSSLRLQYPRLYHSARDRSPCWIAHRRNRTCSETISLASPSISERAWPRRRSQMRSWSPVLSGTSSQVRRLLSPIAAFGC